MLFIRMNDFVVCIRHEELRVHSRFADAMLPVFIPGKIQKTASPGLCRAITIVKSCPWKCCSQIFLDLVIQVSSPDLHIVQLAGKLRESSS